jgi:glycosyltransferase involved in cell wall biosynthesis
MAADCIVIAADHPESAASEVLGDASFLIQPEQRALTKTLERALAGKQPRLAPQEQAAGYDWASIADQAETVYKQALQPK